MYPYIRIHIYTHLNVHSIRVPIFLGPINSYEIAEAHNSRMKGLCEAQEGRNEDKKDLESLM